MYRRDIRFKDPKPIEIMIRMLCILALAVLAAQIALGAAPKQRIYASAEDAVNDLLAGVKAHDKKVLLDILGTDARPLLESGDPVADRNAGERFVKAYGESHTLSRSGDTKAILEIGKDRWPFPIPILKDKDGWRFDTAGGKEEILNRRIGGNELDVIQVALAYVDAQHEYYRRNPQKEALMQYAQKFLSTTGRRDGLYWQTAPGDKPSPLGPLAAQARAENYKAGGDKPTPYHGYYYKILTAQGPYAKGGAYDYMVRGKLVGGFALVAYPAEYGNSGIMTFIVNHDGIVFQKDLGSTTPATVAAMTKFNPDKSWQAAEDEPNS
ncbi:MAG TPA: DUF2950 domain-containing protein [Candidatus Binatia bacterium]|jgi:hypothetical protein